MGSPRVPHFSIHIMHKNEDFKVKYLVPINFVLFFRILVLAVCLLSLAAKQFHVMGNFWGVSDRDLTSVFLVLLVFVEIAYRLLLSKKSYDEMEAGR